VLRPLFGLADTVKRFGAGERDARSAVDGPQELREMSERFNTMADSLASQREAQIAFLAGVAHDLRTPMSAMRMACDLIDPAQPLPPEKQLRHLVAMIGRQIGRMERMTGDFLDLSKIEAGRLELAIESRDLRSIASHVVELFDTARNRIDLSVSPAPVMVPCDEVRIAQVITNLVSNALKYSPESEPVHVLVSAIGSDAIIEVVDHGNGIPREEHGKIFEPFRRRDVKDTVPGTGLGLFNVKHLVEAHGGRIEIESAPAHGSTFSIHLPMKGLSAQLT
jgi:signal transduction histidine kinase